MAAWKKKRFKPRSKIMIRKSVFFLKKYVFFISSVSHHTLSSFWVLTKKQMNFCLISTDSKRLQKNMIEGSPFHNFCFSDFCLFLLPYDYPLLTVKFSYFSDQDWDSRYWTPTTVCRDVPYQAQAQLTIYPLLKSLAENKIKGNYGFCILV